MEERKEYEEKAEIIVNQLKAKLLELEAKTLDAKVKAQNGIQDLDKKLKSLKSQGANLDIQFNELKNASQEKWNLLVNEFEDLLKNISANKQDFYETAENWIDELGEKIDDLEEKARYVNEEIKIQIKEQLENLKKQKIVMIEKLSLLKNSQGETWHNVKQNFDEGITKVKESIHKALDYIRK